MDTRIILACVKNKKVEKFFGGKKKGDGMRMRETRRMRRVETWKNFGIHLNLGKVENWRQKENESGGSFVLEFLKSVLPWDLYEFEENCEVKKFLT